MARSPYRHRPRLSLSQIEVSALIGAATEILAGELDPDHGWTYPRATALDRAHTKLIRAEDAALRRDQEARQQHIPPPR